MNKFNNSHKGALNRLLSLSLVTFFSVSLFAQEIEEVVVSGSFIPDEKRDSSEISAILDESDIERTGDSNIAIALTRLAGLSVVRGKYVYVRGLGERYSSVSLNGLTVPSSEPLKRVVPLDLFPTSIMAGSVVQKTYSSDMPAEFGGGMVQLETKAIPDERILSLSTSAGYNEISNLANGLTYTGGEDDELGYDDGTRDMPSLLQTSIDNGLKVNQANYPGISGLTDLANIGRQVDRSKTLVIYEDEMPLNTSLNFTFGNELDLGLSDLFEIDDLRTGVLITAGVKTSSQIKDGYRATGSIGQNGEINKDDDQKFNSSTQSANTYFLGSFSSVTDGSEFKYTNMYLHKGSKDASITKGRQGESGLMRRSDNTSFIEQELVNQTINFTKFFDSGLEVSLKVASGEAERNSPYEWQVDYIDNSTGIPEGVYDANYVYDYQGKGNDVLFSIVEDDTESMGFDIKYMIEDLNTEIKIGVASSDNTRYAETRSYEFRPTGFGNNFLDELDNRIDYILADANLSPLKAAFFETTQVDNAAYTGDMEIEASYIAVESFLSEQIKLNAGFRREEGIQTINSFDMYNPDTDLDTTIDETYDLPSFSITFLPEAYENLQLRAGFSQTIARPSFRELAPAFFYDVDTHRRVVGNQYLTNSEIDNFDIRAEYYFGFDQFVTFGIFLKDISNPVEERVIDVAGSNVISYINMPSAEIKGAEFEYERIFENLEMFPNKDIIFKTNITYNDGELILNPNDQITLGSGGVANGSTLLATTDDLSLQGLSDVIANLQLGYEDYANNTQATLIVNYTSDRIRARGVGFLPDVTETPPLSVDFVFIKETIYDDYSTKFSIELRNLLDESYEATIGEVIYEGYDIGSSISIGYKINF